MTDETIPFPVPAPRPRRPGVAVTLSDGQPYQLARAGLAAALTEVRDRLYDELTVLKRVRMGDVLQAAWVCLQANHDLADTEVEELLTGADEQKLTDAVLDAMFGPEHPHRTYTTWVLSALYANGLDPAKVPPAIIPEVMAQLVATGRAVAEGDYIHSASAAAKRKKILDMVRGG